MFLAVALVVGLLHTVQTADVSCCGQCYRYARFYVVWTGFSWTSDLGLPGARYLPVVLACYLCFEVYLVNLLT